MEILIEPNKNLWAEIVKRPSFTNFSISETVEDIIHQVREKKDRALIEFNRKFTGFELSSLLVTNKEFGEAEKFINESLKKSIDIAIKNIKTFHQLQMNTTEKVETMPGILCWRKNVAIEKVGLYIPGGTAPLFSTVLMLGIPAKLAGCKEIVICSPPDKTGKLHPAILYAANILGIQKIIKAGGAQAIAAMAFGTESVPAVYKIFGPGNQYVTRAKQIVQMHGVAIDMPAGPSEVCIFADERANISFVASDLLSQAEHGTDSQVLLVCNNKTWLKNCLIEIDNQIKELPRGEIAKAVIKNSRAVIIEEPAKAIELINEYAPEHLIINHADADYLAEKITNAGSVFIGPYAPESAGDYASGTNHTLPTNGFAKAYSGVSTESFLKKITFQKLSREGLINIGASVIEMAKEENLMAHAKSIEIRLNNN